MATSKAIDRVIEQIHSLQTEMHSGFSAVRSEMHEEFSTVRQEMNTRFSSLENRMTAVETKLGMVNATQKEIRNRFIEYSFRCCWLILGIVLSYLIMHFHV